MHHRNQATARAQGGVEPLEPRRLLTAVTGSGFDPDVLPHEFTYAFDTSVADSLHDEDFSVENLTTNWRSTFGLAWAWQPATNTLSLQPDTGVDNPILASGNYETYLRGAGIHDAGETYDPMTGEWVPDAGAVFLGGDHRADLWFLNGDFDRDRDVDAADLAILNANTGTGTDWSDGDADGDGDVDADDLGIVQGVYGAALPPAPAFPGQVNAYALSSDSATVEWATPGYTVSGYRIYRSDDGFSFFQVGEVADPLATSWTDQDLLDGEHIWYRVRAYTPDGSTQAMQADDALTLLPAPSNLNVSRWDDDLTVWWNVESTAHDELLLEESINGGNWQTVATLGPWDFDHDLLDVPDGGAHDFRLTAIQRNPDGTVLQASAPGVMAAPFDFPLEAPGDVNATVTGPTTALITWSDWSVGETGYLVERAVPGFAWSVLDTTAANATSYTDSTMAANTEYHYRVTTVGAGTASTAQTEAVAHSSQANEGRPDTGQTGYLKYFSSQPPTGGWPGWSSSEWTEGALGEFDMDEDVTFRLGELQAHSHLSIFAPTVSFHQGDDLELGKRFTITVYGDGLELYRRHMDGVLAADGLSTVAEIKDEWVASALNGVFEHTGERIKFTFQPSIGTVPGGGGGGGGGGPVDPPPPGGGMSGFGGGMSVDPTTWVISHFGASPLIPTVGLASADYGSEAIDPATGLPSPMTFSFGRDSVALDEPLVVPFTIRGGMATATEGADFTLSDTAIRFAPGQQTANLIVQPLDDRLLEPNEAVLLDVSPGENDYRLLPNGFVGGDLAQVNRLGGLVRRVIDDNEVRVYHVNGAGETSKTFGAIRTHDDLETYFGYDGSELRDFNSQAWNVWGPPNWSHIVNALNEDVNTVRNRQLPLAMTGYSWGGGALVSVMKVAYNSMGYEGLGEQVNLQYTAYVDGITHRINWSPEDEVPLGSGFHDNYYQEKNGWLLPPGIWHGGFVPGADRNVNMDEGASVDNLQLWLDTYAWPVGLVGVSRDPNQPDGKFRHDSIDQHEPIWRDIGIRLAAKQGRPQVEEFELPSP